MTSALVVDKTTINTMTLNLRMSGELSHAIECDISLLIHKYDVNVLCLQEINRKTYEHLKSFFPGFSSVHKAGPGGYALFSKFPIVRVISDPGDYWNHVIIDVKGTNVHVVNVHLHKHYEGYVPFGPNIIKYKRVSPDVAFDIIEKCQLSYIRKLMESFEHEKIIIAGDFNNPSHLDDTIEWTVSKFLAENDFVDSFKYINPHVIESSLVSSVSKYRSDYIYSKNIGVTDSKMVSEIGRYPWPSDHKAVVSVLEL